MVNNWELPGTQKIIKEVAPVFVKYIKELFFNDIGFGEGVSVCDVKSSYKPQSFDEDDEPRGDRFHVLFPYGGRFVKWEVIFDWYQPDFPPDFLFSDDFMQKMDRLMLLADDFLPNWANWDHSEPKSLVYVLRDFVAQYIQYQVSLLEDDTRVKTEYELLASEAGLDPSAVEVLKGPGDTTRKAKPTDKKTSWSFLVHLPVEFSEESSSVKKKRDDEEDGSVMLFVDFYNPADTRPNIDMRFSSHALQALNTVGVPNSSKLSGMPVHAAVNKATLLVREAVSRKHAGRRQRVEFLSALTRKLHPGLIEMDTEKFLSASFLVEREDFSALLSVRLTLEFPAKKPEVHLRSIYLMDSDGLPINKGLEDFPYAIAWGAEQKAERILRYCIASFSEFQNESAAVADTSLD